VVKRPELEADKSLPSSAQVKECVRLHLHYANTSSWRGAQLKYRDNFTFTNVTVVRDLGECGRGIRLVRTADDTAGNSTWYVWNKTYEMYNYIILLDASFLVGSSK
jgi:hypothetical protein